MQFSVSVPVLIAASIALTGFSAAHPAALPAAMPVDVPTAPASEGVPTSAVPQNPTGALPAYGAETSDSPYQLATFDVLWWDVWVPTISMKTWGKYGTCYNLPMPWSSNVGSIDMNHTKSAGCWTYTVKDCPKDKDYKVVGKEGIDIYEGGVGSFICDPPQ